MPTGQQIVNDALTYLALMDPSGSPSASDSTTCLRVLNNMWESWGIDEGLIYAITALRFPLAANQAFYRIGPGGDWNLATTLQRVYGASFLVASGNAIQTSTLNAGGVGYVVSDTGVILGADGTQATYTVNSVDGTGAVLTYTISAAGTGYQIGNGYLTQKGGAQPGAGTGFLVNVTAVTAGGTNRNPLKIIEAMAYYAHNDLNASANTPDELFVSFNPDPSGFMRGYLFPINAAAGTIELETAVPFSQWSLTGNYNLPAGYADDLGWALAFRALPIFGEAVGQGAAQIVAAEGKKAEDRIRAMNAKNRQMPEQAVQTPGAQPAQPQAA